ncbi:D-inositol-3-phosphate glycosyltransferase [Jatrophihabitans telluris]|uniref:D-inositol-3-phosphate glycosyltransferase n=1 Tax=Jatrophihabitans telluris TaxID=2038343 RepID=A0ABY4R1D7_9ACTN|nr:D-inositol-3-phosphate glycosyltransferase [Jatrophihabitans telluris]UQX88854.1 D-inositol-3-phosphate glycosyltransferase [Jatrophihabitans telluris]
MREARVARHLGLPHRVATLSVHTSPLDQPGAGDAGGMNVYILETAKRLAESGVEVEIFTRATSSDQPRIVEVADGVCVRNVIAGPFEGLSKQDLPAQLCAFAAAVQRAEAQQEPGWYDLIHSHYWLSGQVGWLARDRWAVPLVHTAHTLAKAKNAQLAEGDTPEPYARVIGEEQVVAEADRLIANTTDEAHQLIDWYGADPAKVTVIPPGVDLETFRPVPQGFSSSAEVSVPERGEQVRTARERARARLGLHRQDLVLLFVGRLQPLKAPDVLIRAAARIVQDHPELGDRLRVVIVGAPSGTGLAAPDSLQLLAAELGVAERVRFLPPAPRAELAELYRAADLTVVPSYNESFGLVAMESQACGTPVVAAAVGGLPTAVLDGRTGVLVDTHRTQDWADALAALLAQPHHRDELGHAAYLHAQDFSWRRTADRLLGAYRDALAEFARLDATGSMG